MQKDNSLEKALMLGKTEDKRGSQRMRQLDSITDSMDMTLSKLQEICRMEEPDILQSIGSQRVRLSGGTTPHKSASTQHWKKSRWRSHSLFTILEMTHVSLSLSHTHFTHA